MEHLEPLEVRLVNPKGTGRLKAGMTFYLCTTKARPVNRLITASSVETQEDVLSEVTLDGDWNVVLFNDNHNTFDHVIDCLMNTCGHDALQAEQCAMIVHFKGKCTVKTGSFDELAPIHKSLTEKDLTVELNP